MPYVLQSSGKKEDVLAAVNQQITSSWEQAPKGKERDNDKKGLEKIRDFIFNDLGGDFPAESPMGLVLVGNAADDYISITRLELSLSKPAEPADEENNPPPKKGEPVEPKDTEKLKTPVTTPSKTNKDATTSEPPLTAKEKAQVIADEKAAEKEFQKEQKTSTDKGKF